MTTTVVSLSGLAPETFLSLAQRLRREVGANGTGPSSVIGQTGEYQRLVDYLQTADEDVQRRHDNWKFMVGDFAVDTVVGDPSYLPSDCVIPVTDLRTWKDRTIKCYLLSAGVSDECPLDYIDYLDWYALYSTATPVSGRPIHWTIGDNLELLIGPTPNDVYRISGKYQRTVTRMLVDDDSPIYPPEFHLLPVYAAMMDFGGFTSATEVYQRGLVKYERMLRQMERTQLPRLNQFLPLA